jgi:membrane protease YdiL (CAAX protease family)
MNFIQQGFKGNSNWYIWLTSILIIGFGWQVLGPIPLILVAFKKAGSLSEFIKHSETMYTELGMNSNLYLFLMILSFVGGLIALLVCIKFIHKRTITSLITSRKKIDWKRYWFGFISWGIVASLAIIIGIYISPENYIWNFKPIPFFTLVAVSFFFLPLQTSLEELLFRGYFMQGLGIWVKNKWFPLIFTSVVFGLLHGANPEIEKLGYIALVFYIGTGFFFGITTLMDEGTELALGLHAVNNITAAFFVTTDWTVFQTEALYIDTSEPSVGWEMFFPVLVLYPLMLLLFAKKYNWENWIEKLFGKVEKVTIADNENNITQIGNF